MILMYRQVWEPPALNPPIPAHLVSRGQQRDTFSCEPGDKEGRMRRELWRKLEAGPGALRKSIFLVKQIAVEEAEEGLGD